MIVCSCNLITCDDIRRAVESIRSAAPDAPLNATLIYKALGKRPRCGSCLSLADEQVCALAGTGQCCRRSRADDSDTSTHVCQVIPMPTAA